MSDTIYRVRTVYEADTEGAKRSVGALASSFESLGSLARGTVSTLDRLASTAMTLGAGMLVAAGTAGLGALVHGITTLNAQAEEARISIAGLFQAGTGGQGAEGFNTALGQTDSIIQRMRVHANQLPGEFRDLQNVFEAGLLPGLASGKTAEQIEGLSATFMAVSQSFHIESQNAGRELQMLLEGRAGSHIAMWSHMNALVGQTAQQFNALSRAGRFEAIEHALSGFGPMVDAYGNSWSAAESTAKDHLTQLLRIGTAPLFERAKSALGELNHWFEANQQSLERWAEIIGTRIAHGFDYLVDKGRELFDMIRHLDLGHLVDQAQHVGGGMLAARAGLSLLSSQGAMGGIGSLVGGGSLAGMGIAGLLIAPIVAAFATGSVDFGTVMHDLVSAGTPLVRSLGSLVSAVTPLLAAIGAPLIQAFTGLVTVITPLITGLVDLTAAFARGASSFLSGVGDFLVSLAPAGERGHTDAEEREADRLRRLDAPIPQMDPTLYASLLTQTMMGEGVQIDRAFAEWMPQVVDNRSLAAGLLGTMLHSPEVAHAAEAAQHHLTPPSTNVHVTVRLEQTINDASDPDRVAVNTHAFITDAVRHAVESAHLPVHE